MRHGACGVAVAAAVLVALFAWTSPAGAQIPGLPVLPIPGDPLAGPIQPFEGSAATPHPVSGMTPPPQNPFMARNGQNNIHDDAYMTDTYPIAGPLADGAEPSAFFVRECASITFDSHGRIVTVCVGLDGPVLAMLDPHTLAPLAAMTLPLRNLLSGDNPFTDFSGGGYFYLDNQDRAVVPTNARHLLIVGETAAPGFQVERDYDLTSAVPADDAIVSVLPDWSGRLWFVTRHGIVGTVDRSSGAVRALALQGEGISNSFAVDETGGVFVVSDKALYRFDAGGEGQPSITWRVVYPNSGIHKPGQSDAGSGTTPTLMGKDWVTIADNADPMDVVVYDRSTNLDAGQTSSQATAKGKKGNKGKKGKRGKKKKKRKKRPNPQLQNQAKQRFICSEAVFQTGAGSTDQSLIATDHSIVTENNYGYSGIAATMNGGTTEPGLTRVDVVTSAPSKGESKKAKKKKRKKGKGKKKGKGRKKRSSPAENGQVSYSCRTVWTSEERAPSVVPKLSLANGLVYTYTKPKRPDNVDAWYLTTLDFDTGQTVYRRLAGTSFGFNNNYAPVTLGPDGTAYVGVLGGVVAFSGP